MKTYKISLEGCDDSTEFSVVLRKKQAALISAIGKRSREVSTYGCMPTLIIKETKNEHNKG